MTISNPSLERLFMGPAQWRLRMPLLMLAVALGGCASTKTGQQAASTPFVTYTTVGSGQPHRAQPFTAQADSSQSKPRTLSPIRERSRYEDEAASGRQPSGPAAGERTTL